MNRVQLAEGIYWVGVVDWNLRDFHGFNVPNGATYNAYLIVDEKITLIDTVKAAFAEEFLAKISEIVDPAKIDYVISNHVEVDHSGSLPAVLERCPNAKVFCTEKGKDGLMRHYKREWNFEVVKEGDVLDLGNRQLKFIPMPMLHWPDSMATYLEKDAILFSNDAFGQQIATVGRFDDQVDHHLLMDETARYFANILMPFSALISKAANKVAGLPKVDLIAPSHGLMWRSHISDVVEAYTAWGRGDNKPRVLIIYETMWNSTEKMAKAILDGVHAAGAEVKLLRLRDNDLGTIIREVLDARGILVGSPTLNNGMLTPVGAFLTYLKGLRPTKKIGAAFGSYGWGGGAQTTVEDMLKAAGVAVEQSGLAFRYVPEPEEFEKCYQFGVEFGTKVVKG